MSMIMDGGKTHDYNLAIEAGLYSISRYGIVIGSVVIDGLKSQMNTFDPSKDISLVRNTVDQWIKQIIVIPCICHRIHNAYKRGFSSSRELKEVSADIRAGAKVMREQRNKIGLTCPSHISTRWVLDELILSFYANHKEDCEAVYQFPEEYEEIHIISKIFAFMINVFETTTTHLSSVLPIIEKAVSALNEIGTNAATIFRDQLLAYTLNSKHGGLWILAYMLTSKGQSDFYQRIKDRVLTKEYNDALNSIVSIRDQITSQLAFRVPCEEEDDEFVPTEEEAEEEDSEEEAEAEEINKEATNEEEDSLSQEPMVIENDLFETNNLISKALKYLETLLQQQGSSKRSALTQRRIFERFLTTNPAVFTLPDDQDFNWAIIRTTTPKFQFIGDVALRLSASPCSEAECERMISHHKEVKNPSRMRAKEDLTKARMILKNVD